MPDHRKLARWQINRQARFKIDQSSSELLCQVKDINYKGAGVISEAKLPQDIAFRLYLKFSPDCAFDAEVWVAWVKTVKGIHYYGLIFTRLKDTDKEKIYCFINAYCPKEVVQKWWPSFMEVEKNEGGAQMTDQRIFERFNRKLPARFINLNNDQEGVAQTFDVSAKGLGFLTNQELKPHTNLELWLDFPDQRDSLYTRGEVVWSKAQDKRNYRIGVELEKADLMGMSQIMRV